MLREQVLSSCILLLLFLLLLSKMRRSGFGKQEYNHRDQECIDDHNGITIWITIYTPYTPPRVVLETRTFLCPLGCSTFWCWFLFARTGYQTTRP
ncbi:hypothetical protein BD289DRAFT_448562 [Coniella lustricola]|uniref:Secreted protein n=1 Tax=Coniella lustricola TaxID=2025994 RepID=A0A2T2ZS14_9PEZI|nr:hypothetical protein BD289DRAFT_448562 [Coniella lustricola]